MRKRAWTLVTTFQLYVFQMSFAIKKLRFCGGVFKSILHENEAFPKGTSLYGNVPLHVYFHLKVS